MRFYYIDPGLRNNLGHHANSCRLITQELRGLGIAVSVFAHHSVDPALRTELTAQPVFRQLTYWSTSTDPLAGWLISFFQVAADTLQDLQGLPAPGRDDLIYLNSAQAPQLMALLQWLRGMPAEARPRAMVEFGTDPGVDCERIAAGVRVTTRDPRQDARATLYRFAAQQIPALDSTRLHFFTFEAMSSKLYGYVLNATVDVLPLPHFFNTPSRRRSRGGPITVSVLGHQRVDKGYAVVPDIVARLLATRPDIRLLIHNGAPNEMAQTQQRLRALLPGHPQLTLDERMAGPDLWAELLDRSDVILCPYSVQRFAAAYSAVAAEAVASGIPLVVPAGTTLFSLLEAYGGGGTAFAQADPETITAAVVAAVDQFDRLANIASSAAVKWRQTMGAGNMVKALLAYAGPAMA